MKILKRLIFTLLFCILLPGLIILALHLYDTYFNDTVDYEIIIIEGSSNLTDLTLDKFPGMEL